MKRVSNLLLILLAACIVVPAMAQKPKSGKSGKDKTYSDLGYQTTLDNQNKKFGKDKNKDGAVKPPTLKEAIQMAESYRLVGDYANAAHWYSQVISQTDKPIYKLYYAQCLQSMGDNEKAKEYFLAFDAAMNADSLQEPGKEALRNAQIHG